MKILSHALAFCGVVFCGFASAYEFPLQFTPNPGGRNPVVAGYSFKGSEVVGNCSYSITTSGGGRGGRSSTTYYYQTCTWDLYGNLLSVAKGAPATPTPLYSKGTETVYAVNATGEYAGSDSSLAPNTGFVFTPAAEYTWDTPNGYAYPPQGAYTFSITLTSDGEHPLTISTVDVSTVRGGVATVNSSTCTGHVIAPGATCSVTVTFDSSRMCSPNGSGYAYDTLTVTPVSNAGQAREWVQSYTIAVKPCDDG